MIANFFRIYLAFVIFSLLLHSFLPILDEPDISVKYFQFIDLGFFDFLSYNDYYYNNKCVINSGAMSLWASFSPDCYYSFSYTLNRVFFHSFLFGIFFIILLLILRYSSYDVSKLYAVLLSFLFPSILYYTGLLSNEIFSLLVSLSIILFIDKKFILGFLLFAIFLIDFGNFFVVFYFIIVYFFSRFFSRAYGYKKLFYFGFILVSFFYVIGFYALEYLKVFSFMVDKVDAILFKFVEGDSVELVDKYPVILRPFITVLTGTFMTPSGVKSVFIYIYLLILFSFLFYNFFFLKNNNFFKINFDSIFIKNTYFSAVVTVLSFVFILPVYANAKYFVFLIPFFLYPFVLIFGANKIFTVFVFSNILVVVNILLYWL
jgi:hypothetical protein